MSQANPVVVTGATGFLGRHVARLLAQGGTPVAVPVRNPEKLPAQLQGNSLVRTYRCDLASADDIAALMQTLRPRAVIHCAAYGVDHGQQDAVMAVRVNVDGTLLLHQSAARYGADRFIHVGTGYEYGSSETPFTEDAPLRPSGIYGASKASATLMLRSVRHTSPMHVVLARPFGMFGEGEGLHKLVPQVVQACLTGVPLQLTEGLEIRDYVPVSDVARALVAMATMPADDVRALDEVNLCSGEPRTVRSVAEEIGTTLNGLRHLQFGALPSRPSNMMRVVGNPALWRNFCLTHGMHGLAQASSWTPAIMALRDSIAGVRQSLGATTVSSGTGRLA